MKTVLVLGQRWRSPGGSSYRLVHIGDDVVRMSGPGPCRGMCLVDRVDLIDWTLLTDGLEGAR